MMLMAEEFSALMQTNAIKIILSLYQRPHSLAELRLVVRASINLQNNLDALEANGTIQPVVLVYRPEGRLTAKKHVRKVKFYYLADSSIGAALHEVVDVVYRRWNSVCTEAKEVSQRMNRFEGIEFGPPRVKVKWKEMAKLYDHST